MTPSASRSVYNSSQFDIGEARYERRLTTFFDLLGWTKHIEAAGNDGRRLQQLHLIVLMFSVFEKTRLLSEIDGARISTFSDNVVISVPYNPEYLAETINGMARAQLGVGFMGFWLRGAITVGDLYHTERAVFGPALVRAYDLERTRAKYPRILIDIEQPELATIGADIIAREDGLCFLDPWQASFLSELTMGQIDVSGQIAALQRELGHDLPDVSNMQFAAVTALHQLLGTLSSELVQDMAQHDREKIAWLFDRIATRLGVSTRSIDLPRRGQRVD